MMRSLAPVRGRLAWFSLLLGALGATPAASTVTETYSISNSYGYLLGADAIDSVSMAPKAPIMQAGGSDEQHYASDPTPGALSELGVNYTAVAGNGGFYFLHQNYCAGTCSVASQTIISVTLKNEDLVNAANLRFDSLITPGHLALNGPSGGISGGYKFTVEQIDTSGPTPLFTSQGNIIQDGAFIEPGNLDGQGGGDFNGRTTTNPAMSNWMTIDWGATNLNIPLLTIDAGASVTLLYTASYEVRNDGVCDDLDNCSSLEVVFGDPRNDGGVLSRGFGASASLSKSLIGGAYDPYFVPFSFVPIDTPLPDPQDPPPAITYNSFFKSNATTDTDPGAAPEPATWLTMICGFGIAGLSMRRRPRAGGASPA